MKDWYNSKDISDVTSIVTWYLCGFCGWQKVMENKRTIWVWFYFNQLQFTYIRVLILKLRQNDKYYMRTMLHCLVWRKFEYGHIPKIVLENNMTVNKGFQLLESCFSNHMHNCIWYKWPKMTSLFVNRYLYHIILSFNTCNSWQVCSQAKESVHVLAWPIWCLIREPFQHFYSMMLYGG